MSFKLVEPPIQYGRLLLKLLWPCLRKSYSSSVFRIAVFHPLPMSVESIYTERSPSLIKFLLLFSDVVILTVECPCFIVHSIFIRKYKFSVSSCRRGKLKSFVKICLLFKKELRSSNKCTRSIGEETFSKGSHFLMSWKIS